MNAQQLKNAILQEAIEGRLVPQDPNDEPASVLLDKIRKEKARLVKEGKLKKKDLEVKPISEDEIPFEIPASWEWVRLKNLVSVLGDGIHGTPEYDVTGKYYFINGNNLSKNRIIIKDNTGKVNEEEYQKYKKELNEKTILVSINGTIGNVGHYNGEPVILGKSACYFNLIDIKLKEYITLLMYTDYFLQYAKENATGSTIKNVSLAVMNSFKIPLPPLAEQKRIVEKIEELLPKVEKYGKAQDELNKLNEELPERLKKSILQEAIEGRLVSQDPNDEPASVLLQKIREEKQQLVKEGKLKKKDLEEKPISEDEIPFEIPECWEWVRLKTISSKLVDGDHNPPSGQPNDLGFYMLSSKNIIHDRVKIDDVRFLSYDDWKKCNERTNLMKGDVLLTTVATLGRSCVYENDVPYCFQRSVSIISTYIYNYYLKYCFDSPYYQSLINDKATGTAQRGFYINQLQESVIPLPPLAEQKRIVENIEQLLGEIDKLK